MARTRSLLIDNTIGKIFTNTSTVQAADASKLIAGTKLLTASVTTSRSTVAKITNNLSGNPIGIKFTTGGLVTGITLTAATAATGRTINFTFKVGPTYATSTVVGTNFLNIAQTSKIEVVGWTVPVGNSIYIDITQVGNIKPGAGVGVQLRYYAS
jgi:hypothetical protein